MISNIDIGSLLQLQQTVPVIDVRTPAEFEHGHVPGAFNLPLFSNEERVMVGTTYKQVGREQAILMGFDLTGSKWSGFIKTALQIAPDKKVTLHCWRGGMRSGAMAWALNLYGFDVYLIEGGYKRYRRWVNNQFEAKFQLQILGGMTGSGKTRVLHCLQKAGEQIIDLEELAHHQGSAYGSMGTLIQPTQEQFENDLAKILSGIDNERSVWIEDESINIGKRFIPVSLWKQMRGAELINLKIPTEQRVDFLVDEYGFLNNTFLIECTERIRKRLGPEQTKNAIAAINENRMADFIRIVLVYYDKTYRHGLSKRNSNKIRDLGINNNDPALIAAKILSDVLQTNAE